MAFVKVFLFIFLGISSLNLLYARPAANSSFHDLLLPDIQMLRSFNIDKIYQFGDSMSDTGNRLWEDPSDQCSKFPYGVSFFEEPTGRCSDGLLIIDYIASAIGIPFLNPYENVNANFGHGANFAVSGSTALSAYTLAEKNITPGGTNSSLGVQLDWMETHFASLYKSDKGYSTEKLKNALFMVGEIGGNDYIYALRQGKTIEESKSLVPEVIQAITDAVKRVINLGAVRVVVPGNFPSGCIIASLVVYPIINNSITYDKHHCIKELNDVTMLHNEYLQQAVEALKAEYSNITIVYADYYNAYQFLLDNAPYLGFDVTSIFKACCGIGGSYNFDWIRMCGVPNVPVCSDPSRYISWDGIHFTQKAHGILATWLVENILQKIKLKTPI